MLGGLLGGDDSAFRTRAQQRVNPFSTAVSTRVENTLELRPELNRHTTRMKIRGNVVS